MARVLSSATILAALVVTTMTVGCARSPTPAATGHAVRFAIALDSRGFAAGSQVHVYVWNQGALALRDRQAKCSKITTLGGSHAYCGNGAEQLPSPEHFTFSVDEFTRGLTVAAVRVRLREPFEVVIGGIGRDGCNHIQASARGTVTSFDITLADLALTPTSATPAGERIGHCRR